MSSRVVGPSAPDQLRRARERIATPDRWVKGTLAAIDGEKVCGDALWDPRACLCVDGALIATRQSSAPTGAGLCLTLAARSRGFETASKLNDDPATTHSDVLALLDEAIALAESMLLEPS